MNRRILAVVLLFGASAASWGIAITDDFNRSDTSFSAASAVVGVNWVNSSSDLSRINSNRLEIDLISSPSILYNNAVRLDDLFTVSMDVAADVYGGLVFNYQDSLNYYVLRFKAGTKAVHLLSVVDGVNDTMLLQNATATFSAGTYYTVTITSSTAHDFDFTITETGSSSVFNLVTNFVDTNNNHTGGYAGVYATSGDATYDNFNREGPSGEPGYTGWAARWESGIGAETNDYDGDGQPNLAEYGLGGDPTNAADQGTAPLFTITGAAGTNMLSYVHPQLSDPQSGLSYHLETRTNLTLGNWTNHGYVVVGTNLTGNTLDFVTNTAHTVEESKYIQLRIETQGPLPLSDADLLEIYNGFDPRRDTAFEKLRGAPLVIAPMEPPLEEGGPLYTRRYSWSIIDFAFKVFWLEETDQYATANEALIENCDYYIGSQAARDHRDSFYWSADELVRLVEFFGDNGSRTPGLISPECTAKILEMMWLYVKNNSRIGDAESVQSKTWWVNESENHHIQQFNTAWHFSKILQNELAYQDRLYDDGFMAADHFQAWTAYSKAWLVERAKKGLLIEMANGNYGMQTLKCIYNFYEFGDAELSTLSGKFLDLYWAAWAQEQLAGVRSGGKSRIYQGNGALAGRNPFWYLAWYYLKFGEPYKLQNTMFTLVTSAYRMPPIVLDLALDPAGRGTYEIKQRAQGLAEAGFFRPPDYRLRTAGGGIVRYSYCTPDFIMGTALFEARNSEDWTMISSQNRWQGVIFSDDTDARIVPQTKNQNDPNEQITTYNPHWSVQCKGTLITQKLPADNYNVASKLMCVWFSAAGRLSGLPEQEGWVFAEYAGAYAAVKCVSGSYSWSDGSNGAYWMVCAEAFTPVIIEVARKVDFSDFADFKTQVIALPLTFDGQRLSYQGLGGDSFTFHADRAGLPEVNGAPVNLAPTQVFDSPFIQSEYNSGVIEIQKNGRTLTLNFNGES